MKKTNAKKGFSLVETIVSMVIIVIVFSMFLSLSLFASNSFKKTQIKQHGIDTVENVKNIFESSRFYENNFIDDFSAKLLWGQNLSVSLQSENTYIATVCVDESGSQNDNGTGKYIFLIKNEDGFAKLSAEILYNSKTLYTLENYQKLLEDV